MPRYIDTDLIEYHEIFDGNGFTRVAYGDDIDELPTVDVREVVRGKWLQHINEPSLWSCSQCGLIIFSDNENDRIEKYKWCSRCGADIRGKND